MLMKRDSIETSLFSEIVYFRILGITRDRKPDFQIKHEIDTLNKKIDSTNQLLYKVLSNTKWVDTKKMKYNQTILSFL